MCGCVSMMLVRGLYRRGEQCASNVC